MSDRIISKGPIRPPIESGVSDAPQASPKFQVELEPGSPVKVWVSDTSVGRFVDADSITSLRGGDGWSASRDRILGSVPLNILARAAKIKAERNK